MSKILIIEDDLFYRKIYKRKFEVSGHTVEVAENGEVGLTKLHANPPDLVFTDLMMPKKDGFQVLEEIKADPATAHIPVIVLTNLSTSEDAQKVMQKGAAAVLVKSDIEPDAVVARAMELLAPKK